ncbi:MAG: hypothetical protein MMC23_008625 [Stictis urceolatum]|nr:hypothetical protein [Stictis urceolata]
MRKALWDTIRDGWPSWKRYTPSGLDRLSFTITANSMYRVDDNDTNPSDLFDKASRWLTSIQAIDMDDEKQDIVYKWLTDQMCHVVLGSNFIEGAEYRAKLDNLVATGSKDRSREHAIRGRREVVQHAEAFQYLIDAIVTQNEPMTEGLIKKTSPAAYTRRYRSTPVSAGNTMFTSPAFVSREMEKFVKDLNRDIDDAGKSGLLDPFALAAKYCLQFVQIHPFQDGNGRVCRLILNTILCKYAEIMVPIGEHDEDRQAYLGIKRRASEQKKEPASWQRLCSRRQRVVSEL